MSDHGYIFYMQKCTKDGVVLEDTLKNLEEDFVGLRYAKCEGIDDYGKAKNIYTETYSDSDKLRTYVPNEVTNEATKIKFTFYFLGDDRRSVYHNFVNYIRDGYTQYWDTARNRKFTFVVVDELKPASEQWYGGTPYLEFSFTVQNINGKTEEV